MKNPAMSIDWAVRSVASPCGRDGENEDNYLVIDADGRYACLADSEPQAGVVPGWPMGHRRFVLLDGVGGHGNGRRVTEFVVQALKALPAQRDLAALTAAVDALHAEVRQHFRALRRSPGTTLLLMELPPDGPALLMHVGDSRLFARCEAGLELLTVDHCPATIHAMRGEVGEAAWRRQVLQENRRIISQAFGIGNAWRIPERFDDRLQGLDAACLPGFLGHLPDRRSLALPPDSLLLAATDGLWCFDDPYAALARVAHQVHAAPDTPAAALADTLMQAHCQAAVRRGKCDNTTLLVLRAG